jgi:SagB-type dehydrogenase family enzyme
MKFKLLLIGAITLILAILGGAMFERFKRQQEKPPSTRSTWINLPPPTEQSLTSVEAALKARRSTREYSPSPLSLAEISQLLWAAQGINRPGGYRTAPSAGALYPLEVYIISGNVDNLPAGVYLYEPNGHTLEHLLAGDFRKKLSQAALSQKAVEQAPAVILISAVYDRTTKKYGERGRRYVHMEVGSAAQNIYLQAAALDIGTVFIGAFHDDQVRQVINMDSEEAPLCLMPIGKVKP